MTVLVTTHYMDEAEQYCDRVALMHAGRIRALGTPAELETSLGPESTLDDVFRAVTGNHLETGEGGIRGVRATRRTARRLG
jgi:ABC-2 type transport system ATP-binding protein